MANQTRQELEQSNTVLINVDPDTGEKIVSKDHRDMNDLMIDFALSFCPINVLLTSTNQLEDVRLINRKVALVIALNGVIQSDSFSKPFASNILQITNPDITIQSGTLITIMFERTF